MSCIEPGYPLAITNSGPRRKALLPLLLSIAAFFGASALAGTPSINPGGVVNAASFAPQLAAGSIASLFGANLASSTSSAAAIPLPAALGGVVVRINGIDAPLFFVSPTQINFQIPWQLSGQAQASVTITVDGVSSAPQTVSLAPFAPGLVAVNSAGRGQGAILVSGSWALAASAGAAPGARPAGPAETVAIFCTGLGAVTNPPKSGSGASSDPLSITTATPTVTIGGVAARVGFSGLAPGMVGVYQVNVETPPGAPAGDGIPVVLSVGGVNSNAVTMRIRDTPAEAFSSYYQPQAISVVPAVPAYSLPLDLSKVPAYASLSQAFQRLFDLSRIRPLIEQNGFGVTPLFSPLTGGRCEDVVEPYNFLNGQQVPVFVTADTFLHLYHIQFDETLKDVEEREFYGSLLSLTQALLADAAGQQAKYSGEMFTAATSRNVAYFSVALKLLEPAAAIPPDPAGVVQRELNLIEAHAGFSPSPIFVYLEDYSQYVPRGHYTRSETLKKYFKAMMWYGRLGFLLKNSDLLASPNAEIQTLGAALISDALNRVQAGSRSAFAMWDRIYLVTSFYVGLADDLTPREYLRGIQTVAGAAGNLGALADPAVFTAFRAYLANLRNPAIYGGTGQCQIVLPYEPAKIDQCLDKSKGLRFMGQRFLPDSYVLQNLVTMEYLGRGQPFTLVQSMGGPIRGFPRGLDVMDLLGSARAQEILAAEGDTEYRLYAQQRKKLADEFSAFSTQDWNRNLYWGWLFALKPLLTSYGPGYPAFMQTKAWTDKSLNTALASWTALRHDTILYAKQPYGVGVTALPPPPRGYVEPVPEFFGRLLALTRMTVAGLDQLNVLDAKARSRLNALADILEQLRALSLKQLRNELLTAAESSYLGTIGSKLESTVSGLTPVGMPQAMKTTMVADVFTDTNSGLVLEEGSGYVDLAAVVVPAPDGSLYMALGPVLSYYEFKQPMSSRLTDEAWRDLLATQPPARPAWTSSFTK